MGVSGVGKTTIALKLASELNATFIDADDFHSHANVAKMNTGKSLTDADRRPWLLKLNSQLKNFISDNKPIVLACSALKESYRNTLLKGVIEYLIIYLYADYSLLEKRIAERKNHFFSPALLSSQVKILEIPQKNYIRVNVKKSPQLIIEEIMSKIRD